MKYPSSLRLVVAGWLCVFLVVAQLLASSCTISPANPGAGQTITVTYDKKGGALASSAGILLHRGINGWAPVASPDQKATADPVTGLYTWTFVVPEAAFAIDFAFNGVELASTWDNNGGNDWHFAVTPTLAPAELPEQALPANASRAHVMMQGFYWDVPAGGTWYDFLASKAAALRNMKDGQGLDRIWFPPACKSDSGALSMGYDPYDYYDLGSYTQKGTTAVRFGTQAQLKNAIATFHSQGVFVLGDVVANHRGGGAIELNANTNTYTYTDFSKVASGRATWHYNQFHPSTYAFNDDMAFTGFADVCLAANTPNDVGFPRRDLIDWLVWLRDPANAGFDGWRLDLAQGYRASWINELRIATGNVFAVMEKWDGNTTNLDSTVKYSGGTSTFDFAAFYTMRTVCVSPSTANIADLVDPTKVYAAKNPDKAVTFAENHDTDKDSTAHYMTNKMISYAFILTYQGYPCLFWRDYFDYGLATLGDLPGNGINPLVWVRGALGGGHPVIETLKTDSRDFLLYGTSTGTPTAMGYIAALNTNASATQSATVTTSDTFLRGKTLHCYAWYSYVSGKNVQPPDVVCDASGRVSIQAPPLGYAVYGPLSLTNTTTDLLPSIMSNPGNVSGAADGSAVFSVTASGAHLRYQWQRLPAGSVLWSDVPGATASSLSVSPLVPSMDGEAYRLVVTNDAGSVLSNAASLAVSWCRLVNLSVRSVSRSSKNPLIMGFFTTGGTKSMLMRAWGPLLASFGVAGALKDPQIVLYDDYSNGGSILAQNDNWGMAAIAAVRTVTSMIGAYPFDDPTSKDSAILFDVKGARTLYDSDTSGTSGVTLLELYDAGDNQPSRLVNLSARNYVGTGDDILVAGFSVRGNKPIKLLLRGIGPSLALPPFSMSGMIEDPVIKLYKIVGSTNTEIGGNDDWASGGVSTSRTAFASTYAFDFPVDSSKDAALIVTLDPGLYTVELRNKTAATGDGMIEVYELRN